MKAIVITLQPDDALGALAHTPTKLQLFRYSAVTWNAHRIHYDEAYAREEGHPGVLVHSHLRAALALRALQEAVGDNHTITSINYRLRVPATPGTELRYQPRVTNIEGDDITVTVEEVMPNGVIGLEATAHLKTKEGTS